MPNPQLYASIVAGNPAAPTQLYVAIVDANGNIIGSTFAPPQGRLTLTTLTPVLTAAVAGAATVFYTPYVGNVIPLYDGTVIQPTEFAELSNVLANSSVGSAGPAAGAVSENYDLFVWNNAGTLTLTRGPVWTNATTRSAGTALVMVKGILLNNAAITNGPAASRGTYVGTIRTDAGAATVSWSLGGSAAGGTPATLNVWNMYNRVSVRAFVNDSTASWNYTSATIQSANASDANRISMVRGLNNEAVESSYSCRFSTAAAVNGFASIGIGLDATNSYGSGIPALLINVLIAGKTGATMVAPGQVSLPGLGFHFLQACENGDGTNATAFIGAASMLLKATTLQ